MTQSFQAVDTVFAPWDTEQTPGVALAILQDGEIIYKRGYGMAHLEHAIPISAQSIFHIASISKHFTVYALLQLAREDKLSLTDDIRTYLPEIPVYSAPIQIQHLIHHTSGLRDQWDLFELAGWRDNDLKTNADVLHLARRQKELNFLPGDKHLYCNTGYTLMTLIVERLTGKSLRAYTDEIIFKPLDMTKTHFHDDYTEIVPGRAFAYQPKEHGGYFNSIPPYDTVGATSLFTTVEDLARWNFYLEDLRNRQDALFMEMQRPGKLNSGEEIPYGGGLSMGDYRGLSFIGHSGADAGYRSDFLWLPEQRFSVIILGNSSALNTRKLSLQVADVLLAQTFTQTAPEEQPKTTENIGSAAEKPEASAELTTEQLSEFVGNYYSDELLITYEISLEGKQLVFNNYKLQAPIKLASPQDDKVAIDRFAGEFVRDDNGNVIALLLSANRTQRVSFVKQN
jgi:CubicO group peptidase (beta-lactamase class C family)